MGQYEKSIRFPKIFDTSNYSVYFLISKINSSRLGECLHIHLVCTVRVNNVQEYVKIQYSAYSFGLYCKG